MPEHIHYEEDELFNRETHREETDVPIRPLFWVIGIFIAFAFATHLLLWFLYKGLARGERNRMEAPMTAVTRPANADVPQNQPLLQPFPRRNAAGDTQPPVTDTPATDLIRMRETEERQLTSYGWIDQQKGIAHIPIEKAKDLVLQRGFAQAAVPAPAPAAGAATPQPAAPAAGVTPPPAQTPPPAASGATPGGTRP